MSAAIVATSAASVTSADAATFPLTVAVAAFKQAAWVVDVPSEQAVFGVNVIVVGTCAACAVAASHGVAHGRGSTGTSVQPVAEQVAGAVG